jgi:uncharacterized surface protein with fasciclin (FAS1) repeats
MGICRRSLLASAATALIAALLPRQGAVAQTGTVVDTLSEDGRFVRFLDLIDRAGLMEELRGSGPFTVFAPTDQVFASGGTVTSGNPDSASARAVVGYFVLPGQALTLAQLMAFGNQGLQTMNGTPLAVRVRPGETPTVSGAGQLNVIAPLPIVETDIPAANGIIYALGGTFPVTGSP